MKPLNFSTPVSLALGQLRSERDELNGLIETLEKYEARKLKVEA